MTRTRQVLIGLTLAIAAVFFVGSPDARADGIDPASMAAAPAPDLVPGQLATIFKIDDRDPESNVPTPRQRIGNPVEFGYYLQDLLARAESAEKKNDPRRAIKYYRAVAAAVPEEAKGWSLLCAAYEKAQDRERAIRACQYAINREGVALADYQRYVGLLAAKPGDLTGDEQTELGQVLDHLDGQPDLVVPAAHLRCQVGVKKKDVQAMKTCTEVLAKVAPDDPKTVVFQWSLAVMRGDGAEAARLIGRAQQLGVGSESIARMNAVAPSRWSSWMGRAFLFAAVTLMLAALALFARRRLTTATRRVVT